MNEHLWGTATQNPSPALANVHALLDFGHPNSVQAITQNIQNMIT